LEIEMKIRGLMMDPITNMPIVILKEATGNAILPIWVGVAEANAIALEIEKVVTPRPMTHDLLKNVLIGLDSHVQKVVVTTIQDDTFHAVIWIDSDGRLISIDSRPSDALALALRIDCPILVEDDVLRSSKGQASTPERRITNEDLKRWLDQNDEDLGKYKM
jgi:bifunctional DNase/RNase